MGQNIDTAIYRDAYDVASRYTIFELKHVAHWNDGTRESFIQCLITRHSAKTKCSVSYSVKSDLMMYRYMTVNVSIIAEPLYCDTIIIIGNEL